MPSDTTMRDACCQNIYIKRVPCVSGSDLSAFNHACRRSLWRREQVPMVGCGVPAGADEP